MNEQLRRVPNWDAMTGEELLAFCQANPSTVGPIAASALQEWLRLNDLYLIDLDGRTQGAMADLARSNTLPDEMQKRLVGLLSRFRENQQSVAETHLPEYAFLLAGLLSVLPVDPAELAKFYALGGGRKYPVFADATAAQAAIDAELILVAKEAVIANAKQQLSTDVGSINEKYATLSIIDPDEYTLAELEAFVGSLLGGA